MILETLDTKKKDIFIYSENKFDIKNNFRLINKNNLKKSPSKIHFNDVCKYINEDTPKSLVLYRLLTNLPSFNMDFMKYGVPLVINGKGEIIHFDPIFAIKELEEYAQLVDFPDLRFRIQQIGLISYTQNYGKPNYNEVYCFDLESTEAKWQNDRVFAEIIFVFDELNFDKIIEPEDFKKEVILNTQTTKFTKVNSFEAEEGDLVEEDKDFHKSGSELLSPISLEHKEKVSNTSERIKVVKDLHEKDERIIKKESGTKTAGQNGIESISNLSDFIKKVKTDVRKQKTSVTSPKHQPRQVIDLFKSSESFHDYLVERGKKQVILKLKEK
jgi:hypothetical protein